MAKRTPEMKAAYNREYLKARRGPIPPGQCVQCGATIICHNPTRRRYCSPVCRGRYERAHRA